MRFFILKFPESGKIHLEFYDHNDQFHLAKIVFLHKAQNLISRTNKYEKVSKATFCMTRVVFVTHKCLYT